MDRRRAAAGNPLRRAGLDLPGHLRALTPPQDDKDAEMHLAPLLPRKGDGGGGRGDPGPAQRLRPPGYGLNRTQTPSASISTVAARPRASATVRAHSTTPGRRGSATSVRMPRSRANSATGSSFAIARAAASWSGSELSRAEILIRPLASPGGTARS